MKTRDLLLTLVRRELATRTQGSFLGWLWLIVRPTAHLLIFTLVFGVLLASRWDSMAYEGAGLAGFAFFLFAGLIGFHFFAECLTSSASSILKRRAMVKQVVMPLWLFPLVDVLVAGTAMLIAIAILLLALVLTGSGPMLGWLWLPVVLLPWFLLMGGMGWAMAGLGVYIRDLKQVMGPVTQALFFLSPILYSIDSLPEPYRPWLYLNPLTWLVTSLREVLLEGRMPLAEPLLWSWVAGVLSAGFGFLVFRRLKTGFADVI